MSSATTSTVSAADPNPHSTPVSEEKSALERFLRTLANPILYVAIVGYAIYWMAQRENVYAMVTSHDYSTCMADRAEHGTNWVCSCRNENVKFSAFTTLNVDGAEPAAGTNWDWQVCSLLMSPLACNDNSCANFNWNITFVDIARFCSESIMIVQTQFNETSREAPDGMFMSSSYVRTQPELESSIKSMVADILDRQFRVQRAIQEKVDKLYGYPAPIDDVIIQALDDTYYNFMIGEKYNFVAGINEGKNIRLNYGRYTAACQPQVCTLTQRRDTLRWVLELISKLGGFGGFVWKFTNTLPSIPGWLAAAARKGSNMAKGVYNYCEACRIRIRRGWKRVVDHLSDWSVARYTELKIRARAWFPCFHRQQARPEPALQPLLDER